MRHRLAPSGAIALCALSLFSAVAGVKVGEPAPIAEVTGLLDMKGQPQDPARALIAAPAPGARGATLLVFWASWCHPCVSEIPVLNELHRFYGKRGLRVIGLGVREGGETLERIRAAAEKHGVTYPVMYDSEGKGQELFGVGALPTAVLLSGTGEVLWNGPTLPGDITTRISAAIGPGGESGTK